MANTKAIRDIICVLCTVIFVLKAIELYYRTAVI